MSLDDLLEIHADTIRHEGGLDGGVRDPGLLEAALAMPRQQFDGKHLHPDVPSMAAAYLFHLCQNHPFHDGNKRTAAMVAFVFLDANNHNLSAREEAFEAVVMRVATSQMSKSEVAAWFAKHIRPRRKPGRRRPRPNEQG
ncbi:MAG: type II toxin-antitoxin system death-on-curing family toxin [Planctomycetota bacterium]|nr:type II toxin-antitoxin system death-on-curing family toxin [Planctomycetota bacterium]